MMFLYDFIVRKAINVMANVTTNLTTIDLKVRPTIDLKANASATKNATTKIAKSINSTIHPGIVEWRKRLTRM